MSSNITLPGVFVSIYQCGCFITGPSGSGKSELGLSLVDRGHALIADDATEFRKTNSHQIIGTAPKLLEGRLHIRDLGVLDIQKLFGEHATRPSEKLYAIIMLQAISQPSPRDSLSSNTQLETILNLPFPKLTITNNNQRQLALIVEIFVKTVILSRSGETATEEFMRDHQQRLEVDNI